MKPMLMLIRFLFLPLLLLVACAPNSPQTEVPAVQEAATSAPEPEVPAETDEAAPAPTVISPATEVTVTAEPESREAEPAAVTEVPTTTPEQPAPTGEPEVATSGRTEDGAYFLGRVDAPVTIIDYSDFL